MNILVTYAVDPEFDPWRKLRKFREIAAGDFTIRRTEIGRSAVDFVVSGMGPVHAARAMEAVASGEYTICIASGFAGSLRPDQGVGEIVVPKVVQQVGAAESVSCDAALVAEGISSGGKGIEAIVSSDRIATTAAEKARLGEFGDAVDMESYTVMAAAQARDIPAVAIRVISDRHDQAMPVDLSTAVDARGQVSIGRVLRMVAGNPGQISALMKLGREAKAAADALARFLEGYIEKISMLEPSGGPGGAREFARREA
jgi:adenosylhomocysteine nucleosidase